MARGGRGGVQPATLIPGDGIGPEVTSAATSASSSAAPSGFGRRRSPSGPRMRQVATGTRLSGVSQ